MRNMKNKLFIFAVILLLTTVPLSMAIEYPKLNAYVTDNANIIDPVYKEKITTLITEIEKDTTVEIAVLTITSLEGDTAANYAEKTFKANGIGKSDKDNGLLILVSKNDREYKFETGYGLEGTITDSMKVPIGDEILVPNFRKGEFGKGIYESIVVVNGLVTNNSEVVSKYSRSSSPGTTGEVDGVILILLVFAGIFILIFILAIFVGNSNRSYSSRNYDHVPSSSPRYYPTTSSSISSYHRSSMSDSSSHSSHSSSSSSFGGFGGGRSGGGGFGGSW
jgi:uncharacterized protein